MSLPAYKEPLFGPAAYLDWEDEQSEKHEYLNGEVFNMAGASEAHVTIAGNVFVALRNHCPMKAKHDAVDRQRSL